MKVIKKPVMVDARLWHGEFDDVVKDAEYESAIGCQNCDQALKLHGQIHTLEGDFMVCPGDWIITGVRGEHYPCKPDIFKATYEAVPA